MRDMKNCERGKYEPRYGLMVIHRGLAALLRLYKCDLETLLSLRLPTSFLSLPLNTLSDVNFSVPLLSIAAWLLWVVAFLNAT